MHAELVEIMKIGSFIRQSFCDWEGRTSAVIFTQGCNFRCGFCHNPELVLPELLKKSRGIKEQEIFDYLELRKKWLDAVVVTGGEPTLQTDLAGFLRCLKTLGFAIKLDTNGYKPNVLKELIYEGLVDMVAMDIKTVLENDAYQEIVGIPKTDLVEKVRESLEILRAGEIDYQLRTTLVPTFHNAVLAARLRQQFINEDYKQQEFRKGGVLSDYL